MATLYTDEDLKKYTSGPIPTRKPEGNTGILPARGVAPAAVQPLPTNTNYTSPSAGVLGTPGSNVPSIPQKKGMGTSTMRIAPPIVSTEGYVPTQGVLPAKEAAQAGVVKDSTAPELQSHEQASFTNADLTGYANPSDDTAEMNSILGNAFAGIATKGSGLEGLNKLFQYVGGKAIQSFNRKQQNAQTRALQVLDPTHPNNPNNVAVRQETAKAANAQALEQQKSIQEAMFKALENRNKALQSALDPAARTAIEEDYTKTQKALQAYAQTGVLPTDLRMSSKLSDTVDKLNAK